MAGVADRRRTPPTRPFHRGLAVLLLGVAATAAAQEGTPPDDRGARDRLAGGYFGSLPLDGCTRADALLQLHDDGTYALQAHCVATMQALSVEHGIWSITWNGTCVQLAQPDRLTLSGHAFALASDALLVLADGSCIEPVADPRGRSLHRVLPGAQAR